MAEHRDQPRPEATLKSLLPDKGPSASQVLAVVTLVPVGGILLTLSGLTLTGTLIGTALATPVFILFSPVLVPAAIVLLLAVAGFLASGAFGLTGLSSMSWIANYIGSIRGKLPEQVDQAKRKMQETAGQVGQRTKDFGQTVQEKAREGGRT